jgi:hypothetical protein
VFVSLCFIWNVDYILTFISRSTNVSLPLTSMLLCERHWQSTSLRPQLAQENVFRDLGVIFYVDYCVSVNLSEESAASSFRVVLRHSRLRWTWCLYANPYWVITQEYWPHYSCHILHNSRTIVPIFVQAVYNNTVPFLHSSSYIYSDSVL